MLRRTILQKCVFVIVAIGAVIFAVAILRANAAPQAAADSKIVLERVPPVPAEKALATIEVADGFRIEQVAAEPLVIDPVAMAFDERCRMYVVEMRDYSEQDKERLGCIRLLADEDGDGRFEKSQVFAKDLSWPTAVACYDGGVFVGNSPDILYLKDTDGDCVADERRVVFTGFSRDNVQGLLNSFHWGFDGRIYGSASTTGGQITRPGVTAPALDLRGRDFAFDPKTLAIETTTGGGQHGMTFNRWGDRFVCHNSDHLQAIVFEERYLARNPYQSIVSARRSIAADGPQAAVFRASPVEAWRVARTDMRLKGLAPGPIEGGGRAAGYFTSGTGITVYEGGLFDTGDEPWVFVADVGSNLIHRKRLLPDGVTFLGERIDKDTEFVRSTDIWFRPVQMAIGPDGALYVADMYRETIEHPKSLPPELKSQLDLSSGDRGRIYHVVPEDYRYKRPTPLADATTVQMVKALDDANAWRRMTALRLLYERPDPAAAAFLRAEFKSSDRPENRIALLYALKTAGALSVDDLTAALDDPHPRVRCHVLRLAEPLLDSSPNLLTKVLSLASDSNPVVQFQLALTLGESNDARATQAIAGIIVGNGEQRDIVDAALTSIGTRAGAVLQLLLADKKWLAGGQSPPVLAAIVGQIARQRRDEDLVVLVNALNSPDGASRSKGTAALLKALSKVPAEVLADGDSPHRAELQQLRKSAAASLVRDARELLEQDSGPLDARVAAIESLAFDTFANEQPLLEQLLSPQEPAAIHAAVLATCAEFNEPGVAELVLSQWDQFAPAQRTQATDLLLRRETWALALLSYLQDENVPITTLDPGHIARLENYPSKKVEKLARELRGQHISQDRQQVFQDYREMALVGGDATKGEAIFEKNCASCHKLGDVGQAIGPNLASMVSRGAESVLFNILAPNGEVDPRYLEYSVVTVDGQVLPGVIAGETSTAVTLRNAENKLTTVLRVDIDEMRNTGKSLMPEGFEKLIDKSAMADLLSYLQQAAAAEGAVK
ncbi:MAG: HEAT repeat domain-containing protein [Planctomycetes bacterium]|nr:HEAT repeat domain-containing protein [Planctomycetota bacterium]